MFRIDHATAAAALPTPGVPGTPGYFSDGDPATGVQATIVTADWLNMVQEELLNLLTAAGVTPDKADRTQVKAALDALFVNESQFTGSNQALSGSGYQKLPGGVIVQWGSVTATVTATATAFNASLPVAFPTAARCIVGSRKNEVYNAASPIVTECFGVSATQVTVTAARSSGSFSTTWDYIAIGH